MPESTLSLLTSDLQGEIGVFAGWGRGAANGDVAWNTQQQQVITSSTNSGLRQFYFPPPVPGVAPNGYDWSFLKPVATLLLPGGSNVVPLPDDFGGFEGQLIVSAGQQAGFYPLAVSGIGLVLAQEAQLPATTGRPQLAAEEPLKGTGATFGQRFRLHVWPVPDQDYTLRVQYYLLPDALTTNSPYAYGGMKHAETVLAACKFAFERDIDNRVGGAQERNFYTRLAASILADRKDKPGNLGCNADRSDARDGGRNGWNRHYWDYGGIRVRGTLY